MGNRLLRRIGCGCAALASLVGSSCGGQSKYLEDEEWSREREPDGGAWREAESLFTPETAPAGPVGNELNGVRLDLTASPQAPPTGRCTCLDVVVGGPTDPGFVWGQETPVLGPEQIVVALRPDGSECPADAPEASLRRASIKAVDQQGGNVIIVIEDLPVGRPIALGAVTTRPQPGGSLYVRPATKKLIYGGALGGKGMCRVFSRGRAG